MKKLITFIAAASMMFFAVSCNKEDAASEQHMTLKEQAQYLNSVGMAILDQVQAADFQKIATAISDAEFADSTCVLLKKRIDTTALENILKAYADQSKIDSKYYIVDPSALAMNVIFNPTSETSQQGDKIVELKFSTEGADGINVYCTDNTIFPSKSAYTASLKMQSCDQLLRIANLDSIDNWTKTSADSGDIFIKAPTSIDFEASINGDPYFGISLRPDFSEFPADPWHYILKTKEAFDQLKEGSPRPFDTLMACTQLIPLLNLTSGADFYLNGTNSYRLHVEKATINGTLIDADVSICGRDGSALLTAGVKLNATNLVPVIVDYFFRSRLSALIDPIDPLKIFLENYKTVLSSFLKFDVNILDNSARLVWSENETIDIYLNNSSNPQLWAEPDEVVAAYNASPDTFMSAKVIHTADPNNALVSVNDIIALATEFKGVVEKAMALADDFEKMFGE